MCHLPIHQAIFHLLYSKRIFELAFSHLSYIEQIWLSILSIGLETTMFECLWRVAVSWVKLWINLICVIAHIPKPRLFNKDSIKSPGYCFQRTSNFHAQLFSIICILESPLFGPCNSTFLVFLPEISNFLIKWIIEIWERHQSLDGEENGSDLECWRPLVLQDIEADSSELVDIWVVNLGSEQNLWWNHWVLFWQEELAVEDTSLVWGLSWTSNLDVEMSVVLFVWLSIDSNN